MNLGSMREILREKQVLVVVGFDLQAITEYIQEEKGPGSPFLLVFATDPEDTKQLLKAVDKKELPKSSWVAVFALQGMADDQVITYVRNVVGSFDKHAWSPPEGLTRSKRPENKAKKRATVWRL